MTKKKKTVLPLLEVLKSGRRVGSFYIQRARTVVGSGRKAQVRLKSSRAQDEHLVIEVVERSYLEAVNAAKDPEMRHNGESFERVRLKEGSVIELGRLSFRLTYVPKLEGAPSGKRPSLDTPMPSISGDGEPSQAANTVAWVEAALKEKTGKGDEPRPSVEDEGPKKTDKIAPPPATPAPAPAPAPEKTPAQPAPAPPPPAPIKRAPVGETTQGVLSAYKARKRRRLLFVFLLLVTLGGSVTTWILHRRAIEEQKTLDYLMKHRQTESGGEAVEAEGEAYGGLADLGRQRRETGEGPRAPSSSWTGASGGGGGGGGGGFSISGGGGGGAPDPDLSPEERLMSDLESMSMDMMDEDIAAANQGRAWVDMPKVEAVLRDVTPSARMCYKSLLEDEPGLAGTLHMNMTLGTDGRMTSVSANRGASTLAHDDLVSCVSRQIRARTYPKAKGGPVTFSYPFRFQ